MTLATQRRPHNTTATASAGLPRKRARLLATTALTAAMVGAMAALPVRSLATTFTWNPGTNDYSNAANWSPVGTPGLTDDVIFGSSATSPNVTAPVSVNSWTFNGNTDYATSGATVTFNSGGTLTNSSTSTFIHIGNIIAGNVTVTQNGPASLSFGAATTYTGATNIVSGVLGLALSGSISSSSVVNISAPGTFNIANIAASGTSITTLQGVAGSTVELGAKTLTITAGNHTFAGVIQGAGGGLTISGGTQTLTGTNTYTGATQINSGAVLNIQNASALGSTAGATTVASGGALQIQGGITVAEAITLNGTGVAGGGALVNVSGANQISGAITLAGNTLITNADTDFVDFLTFTNGVSGTNTNLTLGGPGSINLQGVIATGNGTLTKDGSGFAGLAGANTFTGATTINGGTLTVTGGSALSDTALVTINAGFLGIQASETVGNIAGVGTIGLFANQTLTAGDTTNSTFSGAINDNNVGDAGGLTKIGTGTLTLSGTNTYTGLTTVSAGTLALEGGAAIGNDSAVHIGAAGTLTSTTDLEVVGALSGDAGGTLDIGSTIFITRVATTSEFSGTLIGSAVFSKDSSGIFTFSGDGSGFTGTFGASAGEVVLDASSTLDAVNVGAFAGATMTIEGGGILTNANVGLVTDGTVNINGSETVAYLTNNTVTGPGTGTLNINGAATTLTLTGGAPFSGHSGAIAGDGDLAITGGTHTLSGNSYLYTGDTTVSGGTLVINNAGTLAAAPGPTNAAFGAAGTTITVSGTGTLAGAGQIGGDVIVQAGGTTSAGNSPGTMVIAGNLTYNALSNANFELGGPGAVNGNNPTTGNDLMDIGGNLTLAGTLNLSNPAGGAVQSGYYTLYTVAGTTSGAFDAVTTAAGPVVATTDVYVTNGGNAGNEVNLLLQNGDQIVQFWDGGDLSADGTVDGGVGTWNNADTNWTTMDGAINDGWRGGVAIFGEAAGGAVTVDAGGVSFEGMQFTENGYVLSGGAINMTGDVLNTAASFINVDTGVSATIASVVSGDAGIGLDKGGAGELILSGTNTFTGDATVHEGTLTLAGSLAIGDTVNVIVGSANTVGGATLNVTADEQIGSLASGADPDLVALMVDVNAFELEILGSADTTYAGAISGTGSLINDGSGTLTLTGDGSGFTGLLGVTGAGAEIAITGTGTTGAMGVGATVGATFSTDGGAILANNAALAADGTINFSGSETLGTITNGAASGVGTGNISLTGAGTTLTLTGIPNLLNPGGISGLSGVISGAGGLTVTGGTHTLSGANTYTGDTTVTGGTLNLNGGAAIADSGAVVVNGGLVNVNANETIATLTGGPAGSVNLTGNLTVAAASGNFQYEGLITGAGGLIKNGGSTFTIFAGNYSGATVVNGGTLAAALTGAFSATSPMTINSGGTVALAGNDQSIVSLDIAGGTLDMTGFNDPTQTFTVTSALTGSGGQILMDVNLTGPVGQSDQVIVGPGGTSAGGSATVVFTAQSGAIQTNPTLVLDLEAGSNFAATAAGLNDVGLVQYVFGQDANSDYVITSQLNLAPIGGIVGGISSAQALINTNVNRPSSAFVASPIGVDPDTCAPGAYARLFGGQSTAEATTSSAVSSDTTSEVDLTYGGAQFGADFGCFNIGGKGAAINLGLLGGVNIGKASQDQSFTSGVGPNQVVSRLISETEFESHYVGAYATYTKGSFFADAQVVYDRTALDITSTNTTTSGGGSNTASLVNGQTPNSDRITASGSLGYAFSIDSISIVPSAGVAYSRTKTDAIMLDNNAGVLAFDDLESVIGFASVAVAKTFILPNETSALQTFVTLTGYNDFGQDQVVTYFDAVNTVATTTENIGMFGELSAGLNYRAILAGDGATPREVSASMRGDVSFSDRLLGWRATLQGRIQF